MRRCLTCGKRFDERRLVCPEDGDMLIYEGKPVGDSGRVLGGRYRLGNLIGEGGMGRVFAATRLEDGEPVAVKVLKRGLGGDGSMEKRFRVEAEAATVLDHPGVVKVYEHAAPPGGPSYIAMERLQGATLDELRRAGKLASPGKVAEIVREVCEILAAAHRKHIIHRDLKPSNIYLHRAGGERSCVKVLDFGVAKLADRPGEKLTSTGEFLGTLLYMAPEQSAAHEASPAMDVYSLGVILFESVAGKVPFVGRSPMEIIRMHATMPAPALSTLRPEVSEALDDVVSRCLLKKPENRYRDAGELALALQGIVTERDDVGVKIETRTLRSNASYWVGVVLDERYEIHEWLAPGRFGSDVYRALHLRTGASVAVRLWRMARGAVRDCLLDAFRGEARAMGIRHPNLITILDLGSSDDGVYLVTELVEGISLRTLMARRGKLPPPLALELVRGIGDALEALHRKGIISGGLSPETIRVAGKDPRRTPVKIAEGSGTTPGHGDPFVPERLLLTPLGLSCLRQVEALLAPAGAPSLLDRSLEYISPEQGEGFPPDPRSDIYSLGLILYEMLAGEPFHFPQGGGVGDPRTWVPRDATGSEALPPLPDDDPLRHAGLGKEWEAFFRVALARRPAERFAGARDLLDALPS